MSAEQELPVKGGHGDSAGVEITEPGAQECKIVVRGEKGEVGIPTEFSAPVEYACLAADKKGANLACGQCRKDFLNRVPDRGSLPR
jgi:hypothetical protein